MGILEYSENIKQLRYKLPYHLHEISSKTNKRAIRSEHFIQFREDEAKKLNDRTYRNRNKEQN